MLETDTEAYYPIRMRVDADSIAENGLALEARGDFTRAAGFYDRAGTLYLSERKWGEAAEMRRRALTCRSVATRHSPLS